MTIPQRQSEIVKLARSLGRVTVDDLARMHHVYPTFGEGIKAAAEQATPQMLEMGMVGN